MRQWLDSLGYRDYTLAPASADASFRSYHRLLCGDQSWIVMDAPPELEPCDQFIAIAAKLRAARLSAPEVIEQNLEQGFLLLTDFGASDYLSVLNEQTEASLYADALAVILQMQTSIDCAGLPPYDESLLSREMDLFHDWFLHQQLQIELTQSQFEQWQSVKQILMANALEQPQVFVHRDFHSRNLMKLDAGNPGILDFQDAVQGPLCYDPVSLLRDCYISWPVQRVEQLIRDYYQRAVVNELTNVSFDEFLRWFNLMGVQRHLKAIGIFSRLNIRDAKPGFLKDIPRTLEYVRQVSAQEVVLLELSALISDLDIDHHVKALR
jgi:aminoglycoside/choline kinase family phosphotransferase